jgi:hypothetical protein
MTPPISRDDMAWRGLKSWLKTQIHRAQAELEKPISERDSDSLRGRIAAHRALINAVEPEVRLEPEKVEDAPLDSQVDY